MGYKPKNNMDEDLEQAARWLVRSQDKDFIPVLVKIVLFFVIIHRLTKNVKFTFRKHYHLLDMRSQKQTIQFTAISITC